MATQQSEPGRINENELMQRLLSAKENWSVQKK